MGTKVFGATEYADRFSSGPGEIVYFDPRQQLYTVRFPNHSLLPDRSQGYRRVGLILLVILVVGLLSGQLARTYVPGEDSPFSAAVTYISKTLRLFPRPAQPKAMVYNWDYRGQPYYLSLTLYGSINDYYQSGPKGVAIGREESTLTKYLALPEGDDSIRELTAKLDALAAANGLDENQKLDLVASFVQTIPYDFEKATINPTTPRYGYEVLFDNKGICSSKSFLLYGILREMGYGAALFAYAAENHMNVGVEVDRGYSNYDSGYAVLETTNVIKIGIVPTLEPASRRAAGKETLPEANQSSIDENTGKELSAPVIYAKSAGRSYPGIVRTVQAQREASELKAYLDGQKPLLEQKQAEITRLEQRMDELRAAGDIRAYNALVTPHNQLAAELRSLAGDYNDKVRRANTLLAELYGS